MGSVALLLTALLAVAAAADDAAPPASGGRYGAGGQPDAGPRYSASMGTVTVRDQQLYRISLRPEIPFGKAAVAFDVEFFVRQDGDFASRGWAFGTTAETIDTILRKIYYVRYGMPGDAAFVRVGALDGVTLGYGLIMDRYRNTLDYPGVKSTGVHFQLDRLGGSPFGLEGVVNNLQDLESGAALVGLRLSHRPLPRVQLGLTYVVDLDQYAGLLDRDGDGYPDAVDAFPEDELLALDNDRDGVADPLDADDDNDGAIDTDGDSGLPGPVVRGLGDLAAGSGGALAVDPEVTRKKPFDKGRVGADPFGVAGLDAGYKLVEGRPVDLTLYGQVAMFVDDEDGLSDATADAQGVARGNRQAEGFGIMAPGLWAKTGPVDGRVEFRHFRDDFDAGYFDNLYDVDRARIDVATGRVTPKDASLHRGQSLNGVYGRLASDLHGLAECAADYQHLVGSGDPKRQVHGSASLSPKLLASAPRLRRALAYYQKNNIGTHLDEEGTPGSEDGFFEPTEDTFYGYEVGFEMASGVAILWDTRFLFARAADGRLDRRKVLSLETVFSF